MSSNHILTYEENLDKYNLSVNEYKKIFQLEHEILLLITLGFTDDEILSKLCYLAETLVPDALASIMMTNTKGTLDVLNAPSASKEAIESLNGLAPGPCSGSCGNVIYEQKEQYVACIAQDRRWDDVRGISEQLGLGACWSVPVRINSEKVVGTFALSSFEKRIPSEFHKSILHICSSLAGIVLRRRKNEQTIKEKNYRIRRMSLAFEQAKEGIMITDKDNKIIEVNQAFINISGYKNNEYLKQDPKILSSGKHNNTYYKEFWDSLNKTGHWSGEIWNKHKNGEIFPQWISVSEFDKIDNEKQGYLAVFSDLTELHKSQEELRYLAFHDTLTGLANRGSLYEKMDQSIKSSKRSEYKFAILFLDLNRFKNLNDSFGHLAGDQVLIQLANRLKENMREVDFIARLGGDEFIVLVEDIKNYEEVYGIAQKISKQFKESFTYKNEKFILETSIGIAIYPQDGDDSTTLLQHADSAMYEAKLNSENHICRYESKMTEHVKNSLLIESQFDRAIKNSEFELYFQPKINAKNYKLLGVEALIRWNHPEKGLVMPNDFINIAEESSFICDIGLWVAEEACKKIIEFEKKGLSDIVMSINVSGKQMNEISAHNLLNIVEKYKVNPKQIEFEITETSLMKNTQLAQKILSKYKEIGFKLSIDDFGSGYSSLTYLKRFKVDTLKIDGLLIRDIVDDEDDYLIIKAIIALGHSLGLKVIAEGVESIEHVNLLKDMLCDQFQGYYFDKPLKAQDLLEKYVKKNKQ